MSNPTADTALLASIRAAIATNRWSDAMDLLDADPVMAVTPAGLELRAQAAYGAGDPEGSVSAWEALHDHHLRADQPLDAARAAAMVAMYLMIDTGLMAPIRGWLRRAERLVEGIGETPVHAVVAMVRTYERLWCGDMETAGSNAALAIRLGREHDVPPAVLVGRMAAARLIIFEGEIEAGLEELDDLALTLISGTVDPMTSGMVYCELICAVQGLALYDRAGEWTRAMTHWKRDASFGGFGGRCRVHQAEMLRMTGPCDEAEREALEACEELRPWMRREFGWPLTELGNIRLRHGDLAGADEAFLAAHANSWSPQPGLAKLRLAQGEIDVALALITEAIDHPFDMPSKERPPYGGLRLAPLLEAQVEIAIAASDLLLARRAVDQLSEIAAMFTSPALEAGASLARGRMALAEGAADAAIGCCETAVADWTDIGAPYEVAGARMVLGEAHLAAGSRPSAVLEWAAAQTAFEAFGAVRDAARAAEAIDTTRRHLPPQPSVTDRADFRCEGNVRTIAFGGGTVLVRDLVGFRYLERLLAEPGREFHVLDLVAVERGSLPTTSRPRDPNLSISDGGHAGMHLDDAARDAYRRRLVDIDEEIDDALEMNDPERLELARNDREYLVNELARAVGLGGRSRLAAATSERARTSVTRSIRYAIDRLADHDTNAAEHLRQAIETGLYCSYHPDPRLSMAWST